MRKKNITPCPFLCYEGKSELYGWVEITNRCNLKCPYCYANSSALSKNELSLSEIKGVLEGFRTLRAKIVMISGGEPTLRPDLVEILGYGTKKLNLKLILVSNGILLSPRIIKILSTYQIPIQLSIDSVDPKVYQKSRGVDLLPFVLKNIDLLLRNNVEIFLAATLTRITEKSIQELVEFAVDKGIQNVHIGELIPEGRSKTNKEIFVSSIYPVYKEIYELQKKYFLFVSIDMIENLLYPIIFKEKKDYYCNAMRGRTLEVGFDGQVYFCGGIRGLSGMEVLNVKNSSLLLIYKQMKNKYRKYQVSVSEIRECKDCQYAHICAGGCRAIAYHYYSGDIMKKHPYCPDIKRIIREIYKDLESGKLDEYVDFLKKQPPQKRHLIKKFF